VKSSPVLARKPSRSAGRYCIRLSRVFTRAVSWARLRLAMLARDRADALGAGGMQHPVDAAEARRVVAEQGAGQDVPSRAVRAGTVQVGHFRQHAGRRPGEQPGQGRDGLRRLVRGGAAEAPVIDRERGGQAQRRLGQQERDLPAALDRAPGQERPELPARLASRQLQVIREVSHAARLLPAGPPEEAHPHAAPQAARVARARI